MATLESLENGINEIKSKMVTKGDINLYIENKYNAMKKEDEKSLYTRIGIFMTFISFVVGILFKFIK